MKTEVTKLIEKYNREKGKRYNEEATKKDFILPLFKIIGWDVDNSNEVTPEDNVSRKRVDYAFKIDGIPKFYLEAKPLDENLDGYREQNGIKTTFAQQSVNYAYYKGCIWAVLTNFSEIRIYDAWTRDTASGFRFAIRIDNFVNDFDNGLYLLSKEAFKQGELDKKYSTKSRKKPITEQLLSDFTKFRAILSKDVYALNKSKNLTEEELDEAIQRLFDRLIFIRNCEDRGLEPPNLLALLRQWKENRKGTLISKLRELFEQYNKDYDSKIFGEHEGDKHLCDQIDISDNVLSRILDGLYTTEDGSIQYDFSLIDADVLGNIYEQYLGHILKKTEKRTKLTESKAKRKEEGIYYTPSYIVDYIVRNTVGELIKNKKTDVSKIKVLDPACGSGSFLIKTFDVLNEYHSKKESYSQNKLDMSGTGTTYSTKLSILTTNIFGVDLDKQAVDIAQLNLLLKVAEKKRRLPILQQNIKNGNSLIDDPNLAGDKAFKWNGEFAEIMSNGGFDVVVGNPPYVRVDHLDKKDKEYWKRKFDFTKGKYDLYYLFIELSLKLLKDGGVLGFIVPNKFCAASSARTLREKLVESTNSLTIISISRIGVFKDASNYPVMLFIKKGNGLNKIEIGSATSKSMLLGGKFDKYYLSKKTLEILPHKLFPIDITKKEFDIIIRLLKKGEKLSKYLKISEGLRIPEKLEKENEEFKIVKQYQFNKWSPIKKGTTISDIDFRKIISKTSNRYLNILKNKIIIAEDALQITATIDYEKMIPQGGVYFGTTINENIDLEYILALLNSNLLSFIYKTLFEGMHMGGGYLRYRTRFLEELPIRIGTESQQKQIIEFAGKMLILHKKLNQIGDKQTDYLHKLEDERNEIDMKINELVYKIYGITEEEMNIIR